MLRSTHRILQSTHLVPDTHLAWNQQLLIDINHMHLVYPVQGDAEEKSWE